jgi:pimeloyl-ACP methyl ester carboxylesterase
VRRRRRFLAYGAGALATAAVAGRLATRRDVRRPDPARDDALGSLRGEARTIRGPRASRLYTEWFPGSGSAGTIILTHGYCLSEAVWHYQKRDLTGGRFSLVTWDLPGHGHSPGLAPGQLSLDVCADALARVIEEYGGDGVVLVGHSLGGVTTMAYLDRHRETAAQLIKGVVLASTPLMHFAGAVAGQWPWAKLESRALGTAMRTVVQSNLSEWILGRDQGREDLSLSYRVVRWGFGRRPSPSQVLFVRDAIASVRADVRAETFRVMTGYDLAPLTASVEQPSVVLIGGRDRLVNPEETFELARLLPRSRTVTFPDAGHAVFLEEHERFNAQVRRFAGRRLRSGVTTG